MVNRSAAFAAAVAGGRMRLSGPQKLVLATGSAIGALLNPLRGDLVATLAEVSGEHAVRRMRDRMLISSEGRRILRERPRVNSESIGLAKLEHYPATSFGYHYYRFFADNHISPDTRTQVQYIMDDELAYVMQRYRECHDFMHVLAHLPISVVGELGLKWFEYLQTGLPMALLSTMFGPLRLSLRDMRRFYQLYLPWAQKAGSKCTFFMNFMFEEHLDVDISLVCQKMELIPFKSY